MKDFNRVAGEFKVGDLLWEKWLPTVVLGFDGENLIRGIDGIVIQEPVGFYEQDKLIAKENEGKKYEGVNLTRLIKSECFDLSKNWNKVTKISQQGGNAKRFWGVGEGIGGFGSFNCYREGDLAASSSANVKLFVPVAIRGPLPVNSCLRSLSLR